MVWPFSGLWSRNKAAPPAAKKAVAARKTPASPAADAALIAAWEGRTVGELRDTLEEVGWDVESLERLLQRVGAPEEVEGSAKPAARRALGASADKPKKRPRPPLLPDDDEEDEEIDLSPRAAGNKQAKGADARRRPPPAATPPSSGAKSPLRQGAKPAGALSPPRSSTKSPGRPIAEVADEVEAMSPAQL